MQARIVADSSGAELEKLRSARAQVRVQDSVQAFFVLGFGVQGFFGVRAVVLCDAALQLLHENRALFAEINEKCVSPLIIGDIRYLVLTFGRNLDIDSVTMDAQRFAANVL